MCGSEWRYCLHSATHDVGVVPFPFPLMMMCCVSLCACVCCCGCPKERRQRERGGRERTQHTTQQQQQQQLHDAHNGCCVLWDDADANDAEKSVRDKRGGRWHRICVQAQLFLVACLRTPSICPLPRAALFFCGALLRGGACQWRSRRRNRRKPRSAAPQPCCRCMGNRSVDTHGTRHTPRCAVTALSSFATLRLRPSHNGETDDNEHTHTHSSIWLRCGGRDTRWCMPFFLFTQPLPLCCGGNTATHSPTTKKKEKTARRTRREEGKPKTTGQQHTTCDGGGGGGAKRQRKQQRPPQPGADT